MSARPSGKIVKRRPSTSASRRLRAGRVATRPGRRLATAPMSIVPWWTGSREIVSLPQREARTWARLAPRYSRSPRTQVGQSARRAIRIFWTSGRHPSTTYRAPDGVSPRSRRRASPACIAPTIADAALKMPAVSQVGRLPGGGAFGLKQRKHAVTGGRIANAIPYVAMAPPYTKGMFNSIAASLIRKRVSRLSVPSTTTSAPRRISLTVAEWTSFGTDWAAARSAKGGAPLMAFRPPPPGGRRQRAPLHNRRILAKWLDRRDREEGPAGCPHRSKNSTPLGLRISYRG